MSDPQRLLGSGTGFERALLGAAVAEKPTAAMVAQMEQSLGLSAAATATAAGSSVLSAKALALILGASAAGGLAVWGTVAISEPPPQILSSHSVAAQFAATSALADGVKANPMTAESSGQAVLEGAALSEDGAASESPPALEGAAMPEGAVALRPSARTRADVESRDSARVNATVAESELREEVQLLDRARAALANGHRTQALDVLSQYSRKFPNGVLAPEARKLRQSAL